VIEARGLSMRYGAVTALVDSSFSAQKGEVVGLLGPNGAGKTTTMRILTTFQIPSEGSATVAGHDVVTEPLEVRRRIGYLPETLPLYLSMEVRECLEFVGRARGLRGKELKERVQWVVAKCGLDRMFRSPVITLSKGYRQRTALAQALVHDPEVVILDEPTTGLDPHQILEMRRLIRELAAERTVMLSTHIMQEATALADRLLVMSRGRIVGRGTPDELREQAGVHATVRLRVRGEGIVDAMMALEALPSARELTATDSADGYASLEIVERDEGLLDSVGVVAHDHGLTVLELSREEGSLENVFLSLTSDDWAGDQALSEAAGPVPHHDDAASTKPTGPATDDGEVAA
jgi:ABC-2 type transport system ATP-binding protein